MQSFAYRVNRTKAPIYVIGKKQPVTIARGARTFTGVMEGVLLSKNFYFYIAEQLLKNAQYNKQYKVNLEFYIRQVLNMSVEQFENDILLPVLKAAG